MINKILLTGSNGFLGREIHRELSSVNKIYNLNRSNSDFNIDLSLEIPFFTESFEIVIHAAGLAHKVSRTASDQKKFYDYNIKLTQNLLKGLEKKNISKFIFISSVSVYGLVEGDLINEDQELKASDPYGLSKIHSELIITEWCNLNNVKLTILRLPLIVGLNPPGNLASMLKGIKNGYYFNIDGGLTKKSMVLCSDISKYLLNASEIGGVYNLTDGYHPSFSEFSNQIANQLNKSKPVNMPFLLARMAAKFGDLLGSKAPINTNKLKKITSNLTFDDTKAREAFGWNPTPVLEGFKIN